MRLRSVTGILLGALLLSMRCGSEPAPVARVVSPPPSAARGAYLANSVGRCFWCHSPQNSEDPAYPRPEVLGSGDILDPATPVVAPNLTPERETGLGLWSDREIIRATREGVGRDGQQLRGEHPTAYLSILTDEDAQSIVLYLRSLKPVRNRLPRSTPQQHRGETVQAMSRPASVRESETPVERGRYLAQLGECAGCHTTTGIDGHPRRDMLLGGGRRFVVTTKGYGYDYSPDPAFKDLPEPALEKGERLVTSLNLSPGPSGISYFTPELFIQTLRRGKVGGVRQLSSAMPWIYFRNLSDDDLRAIFAWLQTAAPVQHRVSNTDPPTVCRICGRKHGLGDTNADARP